MIRILADRMRTGARAARLGCLAAGLLGAGLSAGAARADFTMTILHTGDAASRLEPVTADGKPCTVEERAGEGCFGGLARLAGQVAAERASHRTTLLLNAGGQFGGSAFWSQHRQQPLVDLMNRIRFDAMGVGYAELREGSETLGTFIRTAQFPLLGANVNTDKDPYLKDMIYPMLVTDRSGYRFGLLGIAAEDTTSKANHAPTVRIHSLAEKLPFWIKQMGFMGVTTVIAVSYAGYERDLEIARTVPGIDVIIGANGGTLLGKGRGAKGAYPAVVNGPGGQKVLVAHAGQFGQYLGKLTVTFDNAGKPKSWSGEPVLLDRTVPEDPDIRATVEQLAGALGPRRTEVGAAR